MNNLSGKIMLWKTQLSDIIRSGGFLGKVLGSFLKTGLPLMKNVLQTISWKGFDTIRLIAAASVVQARTHKKVWGSGTTILIISNEEVHVHMRLAKSFKDSASLIKDVTQKNQKQNKRTKGWISWNVIRYIRQLGNMLSGKGVKWGAGITRAGKKVTREEQDFDAVSFFN